MEDNILFKLFHNKFYFWERTPTDTPERRETLEKIKEEENHFTKGMSEDEKFRFTRLKDLYNRLTCYDDYDAFCIGFRLGVQLMIEGALHPVE